METLREDLYFALNLSTDVIGEINALEQLTMILREYPQADSEAIITTFSMMTRSVKAKMDELNDRIDDCCRKARKAV